MCVFVKFLLIFIILFGKYLEIYSTISTSARSSSSRSIYRTNSAPELNRPIAFETRNNIHTRQPQASTSKTRKTVHFQHNVARRLSDELNEALLATQSEHLNPTRDGYYARVNKVLARYGVAAVLGPALGVGAVEIYIQMRGY